MDQSFTNSISAAILYSESIINYFYNTDMDIIRMDEYVEKIPPIVIVVSVLVTALICLRIAISIIWFIFTYFIRPGKKLTAYGEYAIVTGATDGIGKAYAFELASAGA